MKIISEPVHIFEVKSMAEAMYGNLVKAVVDIRRRIMAIDAELHSDEEGMLIEDGSRQEDLWGINILPEFEKGDPNFIEFDSMINLRPAQGNLTLGVEDPEIRKKIISIVNESLQ
ncbi:MAG: hypothetical protein JW913_18380 [Chitinispirillaceae bacterium]|nr:hypothetical protein [Chitinispirillaceae bacterium]